MGRFLRAQLSLSPRSNLKLPSDNTSDGSSMNVALLSAVVLVSSTVALIFSVVDDVTVTKLVFFSLLKLCMVYLHLKFGGYLSVRHLRPSPFP
jgi:type IV secretory pathway TrbL component